MIEDREEMISIISNWQGCADHSFSCSDEDTKESYKQLKEVEAIINKYVPEILIKDTKTKLPEYIQLRQEGEPCAMQLRDDVYFRPAGMWSFTPEIREGRIFIKHCKNPSIIGLEAFPSTRAIYEASNRGSI